jgi:hypothetical protein
MSLDKRQKGIVRIVGIITIVVLIITAFAPAISVFMNQSAV